MPPSETTCLPLRGKASLSEANQQISHKLTFCRENNLQCFFVAKKYLRIFARPDLIGKLRSEAAPQIKIAWSEHRSSGSNRTCANTRNTSIPPGVLSFQDVFCQQIQLDVSVVVLEGLDLILPD